MFKKTTKDHYKNKNLKPNSKDMKKIMFWYNVKEFAGKIVAFKPGYCMTNSFYQLALKKQYLKPPKNSLIINGLHFAIVLHYEKCLDNYKSYILDPFFDEQKKTNSNDSGNTESPIQMRLATKKELIKIGQLLEGKKNFYYRTDVANKLMKTVLPTKSKLESKSPLSLKK